MSVTPMWKLRRLAPRARRVAERRAGDAPALTAFAPTLVAKATACMASYDALIQYEAPWRKEMTEGRDATGALLKIMRPWLPALVRDIPGFQAGDYGDQPGVPDDVISDGERLLEVVAGGTTQSGDPLPYRDAALAQLAPAVQSAQKEWSEAEASDKNYQTLAATTRAACSAFQDELVLFRRTLMSIAGRSDKDYQKLRAEKASAADADDDPAAPPAPVPVVSGPTPPVA